MKLNTCVLSSAAAIVLTCVVSAAAYFYKSRNTEINEVMVFCKLQYNACNYFDKLISFVDAAKESVCVCMPGIHNPAIQGRLLQLIKKKNIKAKIIIDRSGYNQSTELFIKELIEAGAEIRCKKNEPVFSMQHKFCLVDDRILMTGTLNWGNDRTSDHWNYVYITSKLLLVEPVKKEFYKMWQQCSDDLDCTPRVETEINDSDTDTVEIVNPEENTDDSEDFETVMHAPTIDNTALTPNVDALIF
ncbi:mitochondrial cardiolipin hydrolase-like [Battus philenor]|uniref:mitochondrial cardiolipin hydrolase-like n=1 Tax=Battus philenor TaxID=42288 RepID=UPI0035CFC6A0